MIGQAARDICLVVSVVGMWSIAGATVALRIVKASDKRKATTIVALENLHAAIVSSARTSQERHETIMEHMRESHKATMDYMKESHEATIQLIGDALEKCNGR